jgi:hypothetical protein
VKKINQVFSLLIRSFFTFKNVGFFSMNNPEAKYIIWAPDFFSVRFFYGDNLQKVLFTYYHLKVSGESATVWTRRDVGRFYSKSVIFFGSHVYNHYGFRNYMDSLVFVTKHLEAQGNHVFPNSSEVLLWENKSFMHDKFDALEIKTPSTIIYDVDSDSSDSVDFDFPFLIKEEHSCSSLGLHKIPDGESFLALLSDGDFKKRNKKVIIQELIDIRRDLRVIFINSQIVLHYWRINLSSEWKPTSTGHGSKVDFDSFPEHWRESIIDSFKKLNIRTGAFDLAWESDDLSKEPYILEVSTFYQPNPRPSNVEDLINYGSWKKSVRINDSYQRNMVDVISSVQRDFVKVLIGSDC